MLVGPISLLTALGLAGYAMLARSRRTERALFIALGALVAAYVASRYCPGCFGAVSSWGSLERSLLRYLATAYLLFGVAALLLIERRPWRRLERWASPLWVALVLVGGLWLGFSVHVQRGFLAGESAQLQQVRAALPDGAVLYSQQGGWALALDPSIVVAQVPPDFRLDRRASFSDPPPSVPPEAYERLISSIVRAREFGRVVAVRSIHVENAAILDTQLRAQGLRLEELTGLDLTWLVEPLAAPSGATHRAGAPGP